MKTNGMTTKATEHDGMGCETNTKKKECFNLRLNVSQNSCFTKEKGNKMNIV
jgi:hypothetical protein